jgi:hypothetical protein
LGGEFDELKRAIGDEAEARIKASSALLGHLRLLMSLQERIAELRGVRLRHAKNGEPTSVNLKSAADMVPLVEQGASDALSIEDPEKRSRALIQVIRVAPEVLEKAGIEGQEEEEGGASKDARRAVEEAQKIWERETKVFVATVHRETQILVDLAKSGVNITELRVDRWEADVLDAAAEKMEAFLEELGEPTDGEEHRKGNHGSSG